ncbi:hypothetical protein VaNZ11_003300 [Volvox africanus]|uniref:ARMC9 CTLH-like domain-containing protein n=1 Tax=Volvox africanus TaxID=51714 RepID=A0ABQ5RTV2_9CHLO|nr:hypothetical protein VaNZ11_003300 [Volvox africanus]
MDSLPYVDTLFKEYLLFRGFTATLQAFSAELSADRCCGFQAEALCELIFGQLLPHCRTTQLMELLELLADRLYSQLDGRFEALVERMEVALIKAALVTCAKSGRQEKVAEFFRQYGDALLSGPEAGVWRQWAALAFVPTPRKDPAFQAYFSSEWMSLLEVSFRNFLSQVMASLPLPAVLRFNADRRQRLTLQHQVDALQRQLEAVSRQLAEAHAAAAEAAEARQLGKNKTDPVTRAHEEAIPREVAAGPVAAQAGEPAAAAAAAAMREGSSASPVLRNGGGGGDGEAVLSTAIALPAHTRQATSEAAVQPNLTTHPSPSPLPRPPSPRSSGQPQLQPQPHSHLYNIHGRTLSLEAWHADADAGGAPEVASAVPENTTESNGSRKPATAFTGFTSRSRNGSSPDGGGSCRVIAPAPAGLPQRGGAILPSLEEEVKEPEPTPLGSPVQSLSSSVPAAAAAGLTQLRRPVGAFESEDRPGSCSCADLDVDVEEDPGMMLVSGPTVSSGGGGAARGRASAGSIARSVSVSDGEQPRSADDGDDGATTAEGEDDDNADAKKDEEEREAIDGAEEGEEEPEESSSYGSRPAVGSVGDAAGVVVATAAAVAAGSSSGSGSLRSQSLTGARAAPLLPGSRGGGGAVVGGGRWQGVSTYSAAPGALHGRGSAVLAAQFSPGSGHNVATGAADGSVAIWSPTTAMVHSASSSSPREARLTCGAAVTCVAWDARADKVMLVGTAGRGILAWHADTRRVASEIPPDPTGPWVSELACSSKDPVFIVAAATGPPLGITRATAITTGTASITMPSAGLHSVHRVLSPPPPHHPAHHSPSQSRGVQAGSSISDRSRSSSGGSSSSGRLSLWNMRAFKRVSSYTTPQNSPVLSLAFNAQGSWFAAATCGGDVHLYDSNLSLTRPQPLSSFRANCATPAGTAANPLAAPAVVQVYDSASETVLVTCCGATVRLWSLRRLAEPLLSVPLLPYLPYGGRGGGGWSPDWAPCMCLSPRAAAAAVVLGGGGPAVYVVDLQGNCTDEVGGGGGGGSGSGSSSWLSGVFGSPTTSLATSGSAASLSRMAAAAAGRVSVVLPYSGVGLGGGSGDGELSSVVAGNKVYGFGGGDEELVYGTSCSWHPTRDVVVVGYSDGAVRTVGLTRTVGGSSGSC